MRRGAGLACVDAHCGQSYAPSKPLVAWQLPLEPRGNSTMALFAASSCNISAERSRHRSSRGEQAHSSNRSAPRSTTTYRPTARESSAVGYSEPGRRHHRGGHRRCSFRVSLRHRCDRRSGRRSGRRLLRGATELRRQSADVHLLAGGLAPPSFPRSSLPSTERVTGRKKEPPMTTCPRRVRWPSRACRGVAGLVSPDAHPSSAPLPTSAPTSSTRAPR